MLLMENIVLVQMLYFGQQAASARCDDSVVVENGMSAFVTGWWLHRQLGWP
jgi:hypothetical protein